MQNNYNTRDKKNARTKYTRKAIHIKKQRNRPRDSSWRGSQEHLRRTRRDVPRRIVDKRSSGLFFVAAGRRRRDIRQTDNGMAPLGHFNLMSRDGGIHRYFPRTYYSPACACVCSEQHARWIIPGTFEATSSTIWPHNRFEMCAFQIFVATTWREFKILAASWENVFVLYLDYCRCVLTAFFAHRSELLKIRCKCDEQA